MTNGHLRLGVNIDHIATVRNARGGAHPDPLRAAQLVQAAGADGITIHLREDRRHIRDADVEAIIAGIALPVNLEMAATPEMLEIALRTRPHAVCLVPEKREEVTTEGGLNVRGADAFLAEAVARLNEADIRTSLFIDPDFDQVEAAHDIGARVVELHTGAYAEAAEGEARHGELVRLQMAAAHAFELGLEVHAGHGLTYDNTRAVSAIEFLSELNIGHFLVGEALFVGLEEAISRMRMVMDSARTVSGAM